MENNLDNLIEDFTINEESKSHLGEIAKWANINAIVSFVAIGVTLLGAVIAVSNAVIGAGSRLAGSLVTAVVSLLINITLLQAASNIKKGLAETEQDFFGMGITKLATYFKIIGILLIVGLVLMVLVILLFMLIGASR